MLKADGFDDAVVGVGTRCGCEDVLVYDYDKCVEILVSNNDDEGLSEEEAYDEAYDHMEFNVCGSYVGEGTPLFLRPSTLKEIEECL
tara:strand:- start:344 stop:604 length:261 start_codon:yes stop_codon:yes gene_type:complete